MPPTVHYLSHPYATGYGVAGRRLVLALADLGVDVRWTPIAFDADAPLLPADHPVPIELAPFHTTARGSADAIGAAPGDVVVVHAIPEVVPALEHLRPPDGALICHTVWEHEQLQPHWPALLDRCDGVIVPTEWNHEAFAAAGVHVPIGVVPHVAAIDPPTDPAWLGPGGLDLGDRFVVHSLASWNDRKQPGATVDAATRAFGPDDDAVLVLKTDREIGALLPSPPGPGSRRRLTSWAVASIVHRNHPAPDVHLVTDPLTDAQVAALHGRSDCWLSLPHAEGWDLGAFDAAVAGAPVVTTASAGPLTYLAGSPLLVPGTVTANPAVPGTTWLDPDVDAAVEALRSVHADPAAARADAVARAEDLRRRYAPAVVAEQFLAAIGSMA